MRVTRTAGDGRKEGAKHIQTYHGGGWIFRDIPGYSGIFWDIRYERSYIRYRTVSTCFILGGAKLICLVYVTDRPSLPLENLESDPEQPDRPTLCRAQRGEILRSGSSDRPTPFATSQPPSPQSGHPDRPTGCVQQQLCTKHPQRLCRLGGTGKIDRVRFGNSRLILLLAIFEGV